MGTTKMQLNVEFLRQVLEHTATANEIISNSRADFMPASYNVFKFNHFVYEVYAANAIAQRIIDDVHEDEDDVEDDDTYEALRMLVHCYNEAHVWLKLATSVRKVIDNDQDQLADPVLTGFAAVWVDGIQRCIEEATIRAINIGNQLAPDDKEYSMKTSMMPLDIDALGLLRKAQEHSSMAAEVAKDVVASEEWSPAQYEKPVKHFSKVVQLAAAIIERANDLLSRAELPNPLQLTVADVVKKFNSAAGAAQRTEEYAYLIWYTVAGAVTMDDDNRIVVPGYSETVTNLFGFAQLRLSEAMTSLDNVVGQLNAP